MDDAEWRAGVRMLERVGVVQAAARLRDDVQRQADIAEVMRHLVLDQRVATWRTRTKGSGMQ